MITAWETIVAIVDAAAPLQFDPASFDNPASSAGEQAKPARDNPGETDNVATPARRRGRSSSPLEGPALGFSRPAGQASDVSSVASAPPVIDEESASSLSGAKANNNNGGGGGGRPPETPHELNLRLAFLRQTDLGNVFRFVERNRGKLLYNESLPGSAIQGGGWLYWDDRRWASVGADARVRIAEHECVQAIEDEAKACFAEADRLLRENADIVERAPPSKQKKSKSKKKAGNTETAADGDNVIEVDFRAKRRREKSDGDAEHGQATEDAIDDRDADKIAARIMTLYRLGRSLHEWARKSEANSKIIPIARHGAAYLRVNLSGLDADPFIFNVRNGTLIFRREWNAVTDPAVAGHERWFEYSAYVKFKPHDPADRITKLAPVDFDPKAPCERWLSFLPEVQPEDDMRVFLQQWKGYQLTGATGEARMCIFYGEGRNGKGVFEDATGFVLGDYGGSTPVRTFLLEGQAKSAGQATPELAKLPRLRSLRTSEPGKDAKLDEGLVKLVTGGDPIDARHLNRPFFTFLPEFKLTMLVNPRPKISGTDEGIWSRVTMVPWPIVIPRERRDLELGRKLQREASGILNWMLDGLAMWLERGLRLPETVVEATSNYRGESDPLGQFLAACTELAPGEKVQATPFHAVFQAWGKVNAGPEWSPRGLALAMQARGYKSTKVSVMWWHDIRLTKQVGDFLDHDGRPREPAPEHVGADYAF